MSGQLTTGVFITGAAARISQEVAMLDLLMQQKGLILNQNNTLLAGFSSGSLNLLAINSCFRDNNPLSWETYYKKQVLFGLRNHDVFELLPLTKKSILNTAPLRKTLNQFLTDAGISYASDLAFNSNVLTATKDSKQTIWVNSRAAGGNCVASDLFMSSTAIPVVFPSQTISFKPGTSAGIPSEEYVDGGTHGIFINFQANILPVIQQNGPLENLHILSPMREEIDEEHQTIWQNLISGDLKDAEKEIFKNFSLNISINGFISFVQLLQQANKDGAIAKNIYISIPSMEKNTGILDFNNEEDVYNQVIDWVKNQHPEQLALPIDQYVAQNPLKKIVSV